MLAKALGRDPSQVTVAEKRNLLERLMARLAHEIRNPLSSLDIHVQLLEEDLSTLSPEVRAQFTSRFEIIRGELHRLERIVDHFLRLAGPSALELEMVDPVKTVAHVCELLRPEAAARNITVAFEPAPNLPKITADPVRLTQALLNLLINALQAVDRRGRIEWSISEAADALLFQVRDNGPGIPAEKLAAIFDPYFTTKPEGSGLGLWIAQQIVAAHGGRLQAQNAAGGGALFTMMLPLKGPSHSET